MPAADSISKPIQWRRAFIDLWVNRQWTWTSCLLNSSHFVVALGPLQNLQAAAHITICLNHRGGNYGVLKWIEHPRLDVFIHHRYCSLNRCQKTDYAVPEGSAMHVSWKGIERNICISSITHLFCLAPWLMMLVGTWRIDMHLEIFEVSWRNHFVMLSTRLSVSQAAYIRLHH